MLITNFFYLHLLFLYLFFYMLALFISWLFCLIAPFHRHKNYTLCLEFLTFLRLHLTTFHTLSYKSHTIHSSSIPTPLITNRVISNLFYVSHKITNFKFCLNLPPLLHVQTAPSYRSCAKTSHLC
jgi:hypothetical protein